MAMNPILGRKKDSKLKGTILHPGTIFVAFFSKKKHVNQRIVYVIIKYKY